MSKALKTAWTLLATIMTVSAGHAIAQNHISRTPPPTIPSSDSGASSEPITVDAVGDGEVDGNSPGRVNGDSFEDPSAGETDAGPGVRSSDGRRTDPRRVRREKPTIESDSLLRLDDRRARDVPDVEAPDRDPVATRRARERRDERQGYVLDPDAAGHQLPKTRVVSPAVGSDDVDLHCKKDVLSLRNEIDGNGKQIETLDTLIKTLKYKVHEIEQTVQKILDTTADTSGPTPRAFTIAEKVANDAKAESLYAQITIITAQIDNAKGQRDALLQERAALDAELMAQIDCRGH